MIWQKKETIVAENHEYKETDSLIMYSRLLQSRPLWVTLYKHCTCICTLYRGSQKGSILLGQEVQV